MVTFSEQQVLQLFEARKKLQVEPVAFLGEGTYNQVWEVKRKNSPVPLVLRISRQPQNYLKEILPEYQLYKKFKKLNIGIPMKKSAILTTDYRRAVLAIVTEKGMGTLNDYLSKKIDMNISEQDAAFSTIQSIRDTIESGFFCADVKPENMIVTNSKVFMADFDPNFCQSNEWLKRFCTKKGIPKGCKLHKESIRTFRDLLTRVLIFQLHMIIKKYNYGNSRATKFMENLYDYGIDRLKPVNKRKPIVVGNHVIDPIELLSYLLDESFEYTNVVLNHYAEKSGTVHTQEFQNALRNFFNVRNLSPKRKPIGKKKIGETCSKPTQCYSKTCVNGTCVRKNSSK